MHFHRQLLHVVRVVSDIISLSISFLCSIYFISTTQSRPLLLSDYFLLFSLLVSWFFSSRMTGLYNEFRSRNFSFELIIVIKNVLIQVISIVVIIFLMKEITLSRSFVLIYAFGLFCGLTIERFIIRRVLNLLRRRGRNLRQILIVGAGEVGRNFFDAVVSNPHFGYKVIGFLDDQSKNYLNGQYLGTIDALDKILSTSVVDDVIVALPTYATERLDWVIKTCDNYPTRVRIIPDYFRFMSEKFEISMFDRFPVISVRTIRLDELHWYVLKRVFDAAFSVMLFILVFLWLWPLIVLMIKFSSPGPVFFKQERWGRGNKKIICYKFRSMRADSKDIDDCGKYQQATKDDPRITKIGRFLRKTNLDELPQFWNVLKGQMSVVGPRPHPTPLNLESKEIIDNYLLRHLVKPGVTGWAQVSGYRGETKDPILMQKRVEHDIWYIENWTFWLDIQIILLTVWQMIKIDTKGY
ncbi:undecaprenyl-phosphate glucose phosphotransferase [bacterium]|nr:undecaprenyl-phosphate glucose phosphotransferase [bacterium]